MSVGKISEFKVSTGNWSSYIERVEMYFLANKVEEEVKLPTLITFMGEDAYELLSSLASPLKPGSLTYKAAVKLLQKHLQPKPSVLAERYRFRQRRQLAEESIAEYVAVLKKLTKHCEFQMNLEENLRDQFVCGIKSEITRQRLFAEKDIGYTQSVTLALSLEAAEGDAGAVILQSEQLVESVNKLRLDRCFKCGNNGHLSSDCKYKHFVCSYCNELGHLRRMCPKNGRKQQARLEQQGSQKQAYSYRGDATRVNINMAAGRSDNDNGRQRTMRGRQRRGGGHNGARGATLHQLLEDRRHSGANSVVRKLSKLN